MSISFRPDEREGFQWWTIGCGLDWLKLGPVTVATWAVAGSRRRFELHCMNHLILMVPTS